MGAPVPNVSALPHAPLSDEDCFSHCLVKYYNEARTAQCPDGFLGDPVTIPAGTLYSCVSLEDANQQASALAEGQLNCTQVVWQSSEITLHCDPIVVPNGSGEFSFVSLSSTPTLIGYSEFVDPSTPPKKYLNNTVFGDFDYFVVPSSQCGNCAAVVERVSQYWNGTASYNPLTGVGTPVQIFQGQSYSASCNPVPLAPYSYSMFVSGEVDYNIFQVDTVSSTHRSFKTYSPCHEFSPGTSVMCDSRGLYQTLHVEDTEDNAIARATPVAGTLSVASRSLRGAGEFTFTVTKVFVTASFSSLTVGHAYRLSYTISTTNIATGETTNNIVVQYFTPTTEVGTVDLGELPCASGFTSFISSSNISPLS